MNQTTRVVLAEGIGTAILVIGGPGTAIFATGGFLLPNGAVSPSLGILGVALAFGLSLLCMAYLIGRISGCHINPAVTVGMLLARKQPVRKAVPYIAAQVVGGIVGAGVLALILSGTDGYFKAAQNAGFASNGYGVHSPGGFDLLSVAIIEIVVTAIFVLIVLGTTDESGVPKGFGPIAAGFGLALVHMISIPVSNTSVNPARSIATAVYQGDWALGQVWAFIVFPIIGAAVAAGIWTVVGPQKPVVTTTASTA
jgi:aquaporin Z